MKLAIVTISYNGSQNVAGLLNSLKNQTDPEFEMIIVDNGSQGEDLAKLEAVMSQLRDYFKDLRLIKSSENLGFAGGNNLGIKRALQNGVDWVLLLNDDTEVENDLIASIKANLSGKDGVVGLALDEGAKTAIAGKIEWLKPTLKHFHQSDAPQLKNSKFYAIGAAVLINKNVFQKIGAMTEEYFLYFEDADFSERAKKAGFPIFILPEIIIRHKISETTSKIGSPNVLRYHYRNALYFNLRNGPLFVKFLVGFWAVIIAAKQLIKILLRKNIPQSKAILNGVLDFYKGRMGEIKKPASGIKD